MAHFRMRRMLVVVFAACVVITSLIFPSGWVAGTCLLLTLLALIVAVLGVIFRAGDDRAWWAGFAACGWGSMVLASSIWWDWYMVGTGGFRSWKPPDRPALPTTKLLDQLHPIFLRDRGPGPAPVALERWLAPSQDRAIHAKLASPLELDLPSPATPTLEQLARAIAEATRDPAAGLPGGIPIDLDRAALQEVDRGAFTAVDFVATEGVPLGRALTLMLDQQLLIYHVRGGRLTITALGSTVSAEIGAFLRVGHCYVALAAGWLGATVCRWVLRRKRSSGDHGKPGRRPRAAWD